jgi:hypothetical protein
VLPSRASGFVQCAFSDMCVSRPMMSASPPDFHKINGLFSGINHRSGYGEGALLLRVW